MLPLRVRSATVLAVAVVLTASPDTARAQSDTPVTAARLEVQSPPDCVTRADLVARVAARSPRIRLGDEPAMTSVSARFEPRPSGDVEATLRLARTGVAATSRRLVARSCAEAADGVALIIVVSLDPLAETRGPASDSSEAAAGSNSNRTQPAATTANEQAPRPADTRTSPEKRAAKRGDDASSSGDTDLDLASPQLGPAAGRARFGVQIAAQALLGAAPGLMPGIAAYAMGGVDYDAVWGPALVLGFTHAARTGIAEEGGTAAFFLDAATIDACAIRAQRTRIEIRGCASALLGRSSIRGSATAKPATSARAFGIAGAAGILSLRLWPEVELVVRIAAGVSVVQDSFRFANNVFYEAPPIAASASVGVGWRSP